MGEYFNDKELLVMEIKGLLDKAEKIVFKSKYNLAFDNLTDVVVEINKVRQILNYIDQKIVPIIEEEKINDDEIV